MKEAYNDYYGIFGCARTKNGCNCNDKNTCPTEVSEEKALCEEAKNMYCFEEADCNDCIIEYTGLADAYIPFQTEFSTMCQEQSLVCGTVFKDLVMPYRHTMFRCKGGKMNE